MTKDTEMVAQLSMGDSVSCWGFTQGKQAQWVGSARCPVVAADKKGFGGEEILKALIFPFMALSKWGHEAGGEHHSADKQQCLELLEGQ